MGHRLSKTSVNRCNVKQKQKQQLQQQQQQHQQQEPHLQEEETEEVQEPSLVVAPINIITAASSINLQEPNTPTSSKNNHHHPQQNLQQLEIQTSSEELASGTTTASNLSSSCPGRQIIIKIQLAKMDDEQQQQHVNDQSSNGNNNSRRTTTSTTTSNNTNNNNNNNNNNDSSQFLNVTFNQNLMETISNTVLPPVESLYSPRQVNYMPPNVSNCSPQRFVVNNNFSSQVVLAATAAAGDAPSRQDNQSINLLMAPMNELQLSEKHPSVVSGSSSSNSNTDREMASPNKAANETTSQGRQTNCAEDEDAVDLDNEYCCRRKAKSNTFPSKWRCCRCTCRDAFKRIMDASSSSSSSSASSSSSPSSSKSSKKKERKEARSLMKSPQKSAQKQPQHSSQHPALWAALQPNSSQVQLQGNNLAVAAASAAGAAVTTSNGNAAAHMSIWSPSRNNVIIPISSPQFVVVQCPPSSLVTLGRMDDNSIRLMATELVTANSSSSGSGSGNNSNSNTASRILPTLHAEVSSASMSSSAATPNLSTCPSANVIAAGPVVHSQVDYIHCLVPDLERITKASFYWGKMDRYEAERLLEGKPEGTFLLRDSAQEEYLFSVTFRKYGRSLHARIEQSNHKFSFDCHDPCVFTASTVTGLLEHYKDPACVMFFEPMLTIPLHRNKTFTLQQLCRATIVSNTSYDGINELELPSRLKSYLKEYHYKQKLRVKPFDEPFYTCT